MKKLILLAMTVLAAAALAENGVVNASLLNARREPTLKSPVMWKLRSGTVVNVTRVCENNWLEIELDATAPVYVSEAYAVGGKALAAVKMHAGKGKSFPAWGELKKGEPVELLDDRGYGWVRITPPKRLRAYVYSMYVKKAKVVHATATDGCRTTVIASDDPWVMTPEAKPETKPEAKPEVKPEAKPETKPEAKPAPAKPEAKPAPVKPEAKPAPVKPEAKPAPVKPEAKPEVKPVTKPVTKPVVKAAPFKPDDNMKAIGIKPTAKGKPVKLTGSVTAVTTSDLKAAQYALLAADSRNQGFLYYPGKAAELKKLQDAKVVVSGEAFTTPNWKAPVVVVTKIEKAR